MLACRQKIYTCKSRAKITAADVELSDEARYRRSLVPLGEVH